MPTIAYAAVKAIPYLRQANTQVQRWNALPPEDRAIVQEEGRCVIEALAAVKVALTAERDAVDPPADLSTAAERALAGGLAEDMAQAVGSNFKRFPPRLLKR